MQSFILGHKIQIRIFIRTNRNTENKPMKGTRSMVQTFILPTSSNKFSIAFSFNFISFPFQMEQFLNVVKMRQYNN